MTSGTQSLRAVLVDASGNLLSKKQIHFEKPYFSQSPGWAEQRENFTGTESVRLLLELKATSGDLWNRIKAVSITTIRDTDICVGKDGIPFTSRYSVAGQTGSRNDRILSSKNQMLFKAAGMTGTANFIRKICHCNWIMKTSREFGRERISI